MGKCYSDEVEQALRYIYYDLRAGKGAEGLALLEKLPQQETGMLPVSWHDATVGRSTCGADTISRRMTTRWLL